jgi:nucleoside-diphosphate-sugar epimerase
MQLNDGRVVTNFIVQALNGKDITIYGDGSQTRSFSYVQDTVNGIVSLMESEHNDVFNIGNPTEITINELASKIIEITNSNSKLINKDLPQDDPKQRKPDITKAKTMLNWEPKVKLEDGLTKTIEWVNSQL